MNHSVRGVYEYIEYRIMTFTRHLIVGVSILSLIMSSCNKEDFAPKHPQTQSATISDLQKVWVGEYEGWDSLMNAKMKIMRQLALNPDSTYTNVLGAVIDLPNASKEPAPIEKEAGTYEIILDDSAQTATVCFTVAYDSIIDFGTQVFMGYDHKHYRTSDGIEHEDTIYQQYFRILRGKEGSFQLEATDSLMYSIDGNGLPIVYLMNVARMKPE